MYMYVYIYIYNVYIHTYIYIYIYAAGTRLQRPPDLAHHGARHLREGDNSINKANAISKKSDTCIIAMYYAIVYQ